MTVEGGLSRLSKFVNASTLKVVSDLG